MLMYKPRSSSKRKRRRNLALLIAVSYLVNCPDIFSGIALSHAEAVRIGNKVWQNESNGTIAGLTSWNKGENFASLGIGHFIWYPKGLKGPFEESFPKLLNFISA